LFLGKNCSADLHGLILAQGSIGTKDQSPQKVLIKIPIFTEKTPKIDTKRAQHKYYDRNESK
jgi:hypothetical protein